MPKQSKRLGYHVRVEPDNWLHPEDMDKESDLCRTIANGIRRHVDEIRSISVECETEAMSESTWNASPEEIKELTGKIVAWMNRRMVDKSPSDRIILVYNQAIADAAGALSLFAKQNPQHAAGLTLASDWLKTNFSLEEIEP